MRPSYRDDGAERLDIGIAVSPFASVVRQVEPSRSHVQPSVAEGHLDATASLGNVVETSAARRNRFSRLREANTKLCKRTHGARAPTPPRSESESHNPGIIGFLESA